MLCQQELTFGNQAKPYSKLRENFIYMQVFREKMCRNFVPMKRALGALDDFFNPLESCIRDLLSKLFFGCIYK